MTFQQAIPGNDFVIYPEWQQTSMEEQFGINVTLMRQLTDNSWLQAETQWNQVWGNGRQRNGFPNGELQPGYRFFSKKECTCALAVVLNSTIATGGPSGAGESNQTSLEPALLGIKGFGRLAYHGWQRFLTPLLLQGAMGYGFILSGKYREQPVADAAASYSVRYLFAYVKGKKASLLSNLIVFTEFDYDEILHRDEGTNPPDFRILPGIALLTDNYQLSLAVQLPLNNRAYQQEHVAALLVFDLFYDTIIPHFPARLF